MRCGLPLGITCWAGPRPQALTLTFLGLFHRLDMFDYQKVFLAWLSTNVSSRNDEQCVIFNAGVLDGCALLWLS